MAKEKRKYYYTRCLNVITKNATLAISCFELKMGYLVRNSGLEPGSETNLN